MLPVGEVVRLRAGPQSASATTSGATLRTYAVGDRDVVEPFGGPATPPLGCQGEVLQPWPNRVVDGRWRWGGVDRRLALTEPDRGHALHGLVRTLTWEVVERDEASVAFEVLLLAQVGWPFPLRCRVRYALGDDGLEVLVAATNVGDEPCPYGAGCHPYLHVPGGEVADVVLDLGAATWLEVDDRLAPVGRRPTAGGEHLHDGTAPIDARVEDTAFTDLDRRPDGRVEAVARFPDGSATTLWADGAARWWQLFTGDDLPPRWRRRTLALEPMTCPPDALGTGEDLVVLAPGATAELRWGLSWAPPADPQAARPS